MKRRIPPGHWPDAGLAGGLVEAFGGAGAAESGEAALVDGVVDTGDVSRP